jgi:hypothetical protein
MFLSPVRVRSLKQVKTGAFGRAAVGRKSDHDEQAFSFLIASYRESALLGIFLIYISILKGRNCAIPRHCICADDQKHV